MSHIRTSPHGEGYVKVYRKLLTSAVFDDPVTLKVWMWCLLRANFQPRPIEFAGEQIDLNAGDFITGTFSAADELKMSKSTVWRKLEKLERWGNITVKSGNRFSIITVNKYGDYQNEAFQVRETDGNPVGTQREPSGNPVGTDKKERRKEAKEPKKDMARPATIEDVRNYFLEINEPDQSDKWWDHFATVGWVVGRARSPMKDWRAAVRTWARNSKQWAAENGTTKNNGTGNRRGGREVFTNETIERLVRRTTDPPAGGS
jgi:biotin operon repressor